MDEEKLKVIARQEWNVYIFLSVVIARQEWNEYTFLSVVISRLLRSKIHVMIIDEHVYRRSSNNTNENAWVRPFHFRGMGLVVFFRKYFLSANFIEELNQSERC